MNLEQFVETTLRQILAGVKKAQEATQPAGSQSSEASASNPKVMAVADNAPKGKFFMTMDRNIVQLVEFDVAVTTDSTSQATGGASLKVMGVGIGGEVAASDRDSVVSRVRFQVPVAFPLAGD